MNTTEISTEEAILNLRNAMRAELRAEVMRALGGDTADASPMIPIHSVRTTNGHTKSHAIGVKRDPEYIAKLTGNLGAYIKKNPGQRIEQIAQAMGTSTKELNLPVKKLIGSKSLKTRGERRGTQYYWKGN